MASASHGPFTLAFVGYTSALLAEFGEVFTVKQVVELDFIDGVGALNG